MWVFYDEEDNVIVFAKNEDEAREMVVDWYTNTYGNTPEYAENLECWGGHEIKEGQPIFI